MRLADATLAVVLVLVLVVAAAGAACGQRGPSSSPVGNRAQPPPVDAGDPDALPADVQALIDRWESCEHWSGEEPYDAERAEEIRAAIERSCPGNDAERARLEHRYADRPRILEHLRALTE